MIEITDTISLQDHELSFQFIRASGPGGQNVNKVATAVKLRFDVLQSPSLPHLVRKRLLSQAKNRISSEGILTIDARRYRSQDRNKTDAIERLIGLIRKATVVPKRRKPTRVSASAKQRRLEEKKRRGGTKRLRGRVNSDAD